MSIGSLLHPGIVLFVLGSAALAYLSRRSLGRPRTHGFYRFWAWEAILALVLLQAPHWFRKPLARHQLVSWLLLLASPLPLVLGLWSLGRGRPSPRRQDATLLGLERTTELITTGIYRYIRHPMYSSLLLLTWGAFFKRPGWRAGVLAGLATACLVATAKVEETENIRFFGVSYRTYMNGTRRFIPFLF